jgi:hypothetical protein
LKAIDAPLVSLLLARLTESLSGDWVLLGGAVLPLVGITHRVTYDIDLAGPPDAPQVLELVELAAGMGLPPEAVNQAAAFFLHRIEGWSRHLIPVVSGARARVFRPDATLYVRLKIGRLSDADLADCLRYLEFAAAHGEPADADGLMRAVRAETRKRPGPERAARLRTLLRALG